MADQQKKNGAGRPEIDLEAGLPKTRNTLSVQETSRYLNLSDDHIYRLVEEGELAGEKHALPTEGNTATGRPRPRYLRIHKESAIAYRRRRQIRP